MTLPCRAGAARSLSLAATMAVVPAPIALPTSSAAVTRVTRCLATRQVPDGVRCHREGPAAGGGGDGSVGIWAVSSAGGSTGRSGSSVLISCLSRCQDISVRRRPGHCPVQVFEGRECPFDVVPRDHLAARLAHPGPLF